MRAFLPREHGLLVWVGLPLLAAVAQAPGLPAILAASVVTLGFGAFNALRRRERRASLLAASLALAALVPALAWSAHPATLALGLLVGALAALGGLREGPLSRRPEVMVLGMAALNAVGASLAMAAGSPSTHAAVVALVLLAWQVAGLWWVRRSMAAVLPRRSPWRGGWSVALALAAAAVAAGCWYGLLTIPAALLLYPLRILLHPAPAHPRDAARVGMTELGWSVLALTAVIAATA